MNELLNRLIANDFADLDGLEIAGSVPVKQELLNEALAGLLRQGQEASAPSPSPSPAAGEGSGRREASRIDPKTLLKFVRRAEVTADDGKLTLHFHVLVGGGEG